MQYMAIPANGNTQPCRNPISKLNIISCAAALVREYLLANLLF